MTKIYYRTERIDDDGPTSKDLAQINRMRARLKKSRDPSTAVDPVDAFDRYEPNSRTATFVGCDEQIIHIWTVTDISHEQAMNIGKCWSDTTVGIRAFETIVSQTVGSQVRREQV